MYQIHIADDFYADGISLYITQKLDGGRRAVMHVGSVNSYGEWTEIDPVVSSSDVTPTIRLNGEAALALLEALARHYQGLPDLHQVRADLLEERKRTDKLINALIDSNAMRNRSA